VGFTDMSRRFTSESLHSGASLWLTRQGISLEHLPQQSAESDDSPCGVVAACRHAVGTISSSETRADVRRMASEDSARISAIGLSC